MIISTKDLIKTYKGLVPTKALRGVSLGIKKGEFVGLMGPSGSGKSTLLHQLGLLDSPTSGQIIIDGKDVTSYSEKEKSDFRLNKLGYVFQFQALLPELTAIESVYLPLMLTGASKKVYIEKATKMLEEVGLGDRLHHLPKQLSGGEQQRVSIARALVNDPDVLFADEPTSSLDTESSLSVLKLFRRLNDDLGQTILMVTHEPSHKEHVDRVIWLEDGKLKKK
jgi:putative ABC transport system ATP-binding protein